MIDLIRVDCSGCLSSALADQIWLLKKKRVPTFVLLRNWVWVFLKQLLCMWTSSDLGCWWFIGIGSNFPDRRKLSNLIYGRCYSHILCLIVATCGSWILGCCMWDKCRSQYSWFREIVMLWLGGQLMIKICKKSCIFWKMTRYVVYACLRFLLSHCIS